MKGRAALANQAYRAALQLRSRTHRALDTPVCPFDVANEIGLEVRFVDIPSLEAMYVDDGAPKILIAADRPLGRQRFSCAHELGHHVFHHGTHASSMVSDSSRQQREHSDEEFIAQAFAGFFLFPKTAVSKAFAVRGWDPSLGAPVQYFRVACALGASFDGFVTHCEHGLRLLAAARAGTLHRVDLRQLRANLAGSPVTGHLLALDETGLSFATDACVGDLLLVPADARPTNGGLTMESSGPHGALLRAQRSGLTGVEFGPQSAVGVVRVSRAKYVGRSIFRHLEDPDDV